jgi:hypothetical protein
MVFLRVVVNYAQDMEKRAYIWKVDKKPCVGVSYLLYDYLFEPLFPLLGNGTDRTCVYSCFENYVKTEYFTHR